MDALILSPPLSNRADKIPRMSVCENFNNKLYRTKTKMVFYIKIFFPKTKMQQMSFYDKKGPFSRKKYWAYFLLIQIHSVLWSRKSEWTSMAKVSHF